MTRTSKTLEQLDGQDGGEPNYPTYLVRRVHELRCQPLADFTGGDLRIMLLQQVGMEYLTPLALDCLEADPFAEGAYYPGDLLHAVIQLPRAYWVAHPPEAGGIATIADRAAELLGARKLSDEIKAKLRRLMEVSIVS